MDVIHVCLNVSDAERLAEWYTNAFDLERTWEFTTEDGTTHNVYVADGDGFELQLSDTEGESEFDAGDAWDHLAVAVDDVDAAFEAIEADLGTVDILVNNVGDFEPTHWAEQSVDDWRRVYETNLVGTMCCARRALPGMRENGWGRIVNVGYASAEKGLVAAKNFPYFAAKAGVLMFTRMLAAETQDDGITVNAVSPYVVETSDEFPEDAPRGRWATVDDLAHVVRFFCDDASGYVSGENVEVDGGWLPEDV